MNISVVKTCETKYDKQRIGMEHILGHKTGLNKFKRIENMKTMSLTKMYLD